MLSLAVVLAVVGVFVGVVALSGVMLSFKSGRSRRLRSPFDCGFSPIIGSREPISVRFFVTAVLFVVFDVEVVILLPVLIGVTRISQRLFLLYMLILLGGLFHEWREGTLEWQN